MSAWKSGLPQSGWKVSCFLLGEKKRHFRPLDGRIPKNKNTKKALFFVGFPEDAWDWYIYLHLP